MMRDNFAFTTGLFSFDKKLSEGTFHPRILKTNHLVGLSIHLVRDFFIFFYWMCVICSVLTLAEVLPFLKKNLI